MHMGCVAHQYAKWRPPPLKWSCTPAALSEEGESVTTAFFQHHHRSMCHMQIVLAVV